MMMACVSRNVRSLSLTGWSGRELAWLERATLSAIARRANEHDFLRKSNGMLRKCSSHWRPEMKRKVLGAVGEIRQGDGPEVAWKTHMY